MNIEPRAQRLIRSTAYWVLGMTVVAAGVGLLGLTQIPKDPLPSLAAVAVSGWLAFTLGRVGYALSRPPSPTALKQGVLALRSFFRAMVICGALAVVAGRVPSPVSCELELNEEDDQDDQGEALGVERRNPTGPLARELGGILAAGLSRSCVDVKAPECAEVSRSVGAARAPLRSRKIPAGDVAVATNWKLCQRDHFAQLQSEVRVTSEEGVTRGVIVSSFIRTNDDTWFLVSVEKKGAGPEDCAVVPFHNVKGAKEFVSVGWESGDEQGESDVLLLDRVWMYNCVIEEVEIWIGDEEQPTVLNPGCWLDEGWEVGALSKTFELPMPPPDEVTVTALYVDGVRGGSKLINPRLEGVSPGPSEEPTAQEPSVELEAKPETEVEEESQPPTSEDATTYAEAAAILEPCWRMLGDDLPVRTGTRCAEAYDRTLGVVGADGGRLSEVLRQAAEVGRAWNDADAALSVVPAPSAAERRKIEKRKRRAYRRESELLQARTVALLDFARRAFAEAEGESDCDRRQGLLLQALAALPVEFDEAAMKSVTDLAGVGAAVEHARTALRRAEEACVSRPDDPEDSRFRGDAKKMILDALELGAARKEHSRCMDGRLEQVCARPGGIDPHLRLVVLDAIRTLTRR